MRRCLFITLLLMILPVPQARPQAAGCLALDLPDWSILQPSEVTGPGWFVFTRSYFCLSDWNFSGAGIQWYTPASATGALACRDGIAGFARHHLFLTHHREAGRVSSALQLRFTLITAQPHPAAFRLGGNARIACRLTDRALVGADLYDLPGLIALETPLTHGDPRLRGFLLFHPDERLSLMMSLELSSLASGPLTGGFRLSLPGNLALEAQIHLLPCGVGVGLTWNAGLTRFRTLFDHHTGPGLTPTILVDRRTANHRAP